MSPLAKLNNKKKDAEFNLDNKYYTYATIKGKDVGYCEVANAQVGSKHYHDSCKITQYKLLIHNAYI